MDEQTTTGDVAADTGADLLAVPEETNDEPAASQPTEPTPEPSTPEGDAPASVPEVDEKLVSFAKGQGIEDVENLTPREKSLLKSAYDNKAEQDRTRQKASELEKTLTAGLETDVNTASPDDVTRLAAEVQGLKLAQTVTGFFQANPDAREFEARMTEIVNDRPDIGQLVKAGYLNVSDLYQLAKGGDTSREAQLKADGGKEALQAVASKQQAKAVPGVATNSQLSQASEDPFLAGFDKPSI